MALPKGKLLALVTVFVAIGLVTATGAFTTVSAQRTAEVNVAGDSNALLQLNPESDWAEIGDDGVMAITMGGSQGVNLEARTTAEPLFNVTNNGQNTVYVWIKVNFNESLTVDQDANKESAIKFYNANSLDDSSKTDITDKSNAVALDSGDGFNVTLLIDTRGEHFDDLGDYDETNNPENRIVDSITIYANSTDPSA